MVMSQLIILTQNNCRVNLLPRIKKIVKCHRKEQRLLGYLTSPFSIISSQSLKTLVKNYAAQSHSNSLRR